MCRKLTIVLALSTLTLVGGGDAVSAAAGIRQAATIDARLADTRAQIARAELDDRRATDDDVKRLIAVRLAILRNTEAMLEQKQISLEQGITLTYTVEGAVYRPEPPDAELVAGLRAAIADTEAQVDAAIAKAATQTDLAARATAAAGVATLENTLAMLRQRWYAATYSIPYVGPERAEPAAAETAPPPSTPEPPPIAGGVEMVEITLRITETTTTWWEMSWWLTLRNANDVDVPVNATIQFLDEEGKVVAEDAAPDLLVPASREQVFRGASRVDAVVAPRVKAIYAKIRYTRD